MVYIIRNPKESHDPEGRWQVVDFDDWIGWLESRRAELPVKGYFTSASEAEVFRNRLNHPEQKDVDAGNS